jgi:hypothetical protein
VQLSVADLSRIGIKAKNLPCRTRAVDLADLGRALRSSATKETCPPHPRNKRQILEKSRFIFEEISIASWRGNTAFHPMDFEVFLLRISEAEEGGGYTISTSSWFHDRPSSSRNIACLQPLQRTEK